MDLPRQLQETGAILRKLHWMRGLRAGLAVSTAMIVCHLLGQPMGWAALGGFEAILVDNGGPYRSRFATISTLMLAGTVVCIIGSTAVGWNPLTELLVPMLVTAAVCFVVTFARVVAQPVASTSVIILVIYFAALGSGAHSIEQSLWNSLAFVLGGGWAAVLSLVLWPVDPFRPARLAVAQCYVLLAQFTEGIEPTERESDAREAARQRGFAWQRAMRLQMEAARTALGSTAARMPARTIRARNLTVLLETVDMLFVGTIRMTELALGIEAASGLRQDDPQREFVRWLSDAENAVAAALQHRPLDGAVFCATQGSISAEGILRQATSLAADDNGAVLAHFAVAELDALQNIEIACEAVKAVWSGVEAKAGTSRLTVAVEAVGETKPPAWADALRANWTLDSVMMRHALRMLVVGAVDILLLYVLHLSHGFWLAMTSIIVLQPYQSNTLKRGVQRVGGTIAGGVFAALLAAVIHSQAGIIAVVTVTSLLTLATYAVDYAWYSFFLTPTFVLLSLPHLRDWRYSGVRMLTTALGAAVAVAAMRLLWPEREHINLGRMLSRSAAADAAYLRALLRYWKTLRHKEMAIDNSPAVLIPIEVRAVAEREILAPARRACGLASNDAEESLDRLVLEPGFGRLAATPSSSHVQDHALTFVTYVRRLTQSVTTLAVLGRTNPETAAKLERLEERLELLSRALQSGGAKSVARPCRSGDTGGSGQESDIALHQLQRMERQVSILERAAAGLMKGKTASDVVST